jgi:hypothetical protein
MDSAIRCRSAAARILGPAFTVRCRDDFLGVLRAVELASLGDVIVVDGGASQIALAGELFARGALARGLGGIIVDAGYRDMIYVASWYQARRRVPIRSVGPVGCFARDGAGAETTWPVGGVEREPTWPQRVLMWRC